MVGYAITIEKVALRAKGVGAVTLCDVIDNLFTTLCTPTNATCLFGFPPHRSLSFKVILSHVRAFWRDLNIRRRFGAY